MWARRCGAPPGWPSRVKVLLFSSFSGTIGLSVYNYMQAGSMSYLDFEQSTSEVSMCLSEWPSRSSATDMSNPKDWFDTEIEWEAQHPCPQATPTPCNGVAVPLHVLANPLAVAMGPGSRINLTDAGYSSYTMDQMVFWARCFLVISCFLWAGMTVHDLALSGGGAKDYVLDIMGVNERFPLIRRMWRRTAGLSFYRHVSAHHKGSVRIAGMIFMIVVSPALVVWNLFVFHFLIAPVILGTFALYPIRMSRVWVFIVAILSALYGLALTIHFLVLSFDHDQRPRYAATWPVVINDAGETLVVSSGGDCVCGCNYVISWAVCANVSVVGGITLFKSICIGLRCLKGLRRTQWASLLSVLFPVPLTVYEVSWRRHDDRPIKFRQEGQPVQGEYAFDPFAMMDEQEDSAYTTVNLRPAPIHFKDDDEGQRVCVGASSRVLAMPSMPKRSYSEENIKGKEYIGCCGFPWRTSGKMVRWETMEEALAAHEQLFTSLGKLDEAGEEQEDADTEQLEVRTVESSPAAVKVGASGAAPVEFRASQDPLPSSQAQSLHIPLGVDASTAERPVVVEEAGLGALPSPHAPLDGEHAGGACNGAGQRKAAGMPLSECQRDNVANGCGSRRQLKEVDLDHPCSSDEEVDDAGALGSVEKPPEGCRRGVPGLRLCC